MIDNMERRRFRRYKVKDNAVAFLGKSACAILDISAVGISVRYSLIEQDAADSAHLDIFLADTRFYLPQVPVEIVDEVMTSPIPCSVPCGLSGLGSGLRIFLWNRRPASTNLSPIIKTWSISPCQHTH